MECAQMLTTAGLVLDIAGVVTIFIYGPPQPPLEARGTSLLLVETTDQEKQVAEARRARYSVMSRTGLALLAVGFLLQLIATWSK